MSRGRREGNFECQTRLTIEFIAKLSPSLRAKFCYCFDGCVGIPLDVSCLKWKDPRIPAILLTPLRANTQGLVDGGLAGLFWAYIWNFFGFSFVVLSLAEMASMLVAVKICFQDISNIPQGTYFWRTISLGLRIRAS
jgi:hypothetical protein